MNPLDFAQFGVAIFSMAVLGFVIREFLKFAKNQENNFVGVIKNHLRHSTKATNKLEKTVKELIIFLKNNNKK